MASCKIGHVYIINTVLTKPPKPKFSLCVCEERGYFVWINSDPRSHGKDQLEIAANCHELIKHKSYIDLSRIVAHPNNEIEDAKEFPRISNEMLKKILDATDGGLQVMPPRQGLLMRNNLANLMAS